MVAEAKDNNHSVSDIILYIFRIFVSYLDDSQKKCMSMFPDMMSLGELQMSFLCFMLQKFIYRHHIKMTIFTMKIYYISS